MFKYPLLKWSNDQCNTNLIINNYIQAPSKFVLLFFITPSERQSILNMDISMYTSIHRLVLNITESEDTKNFLS